MLSLITTLSYAAGAVPGYGYALQMLAGRNVLVAGGAGDGVAAAPPHRLFRPDSYGAADLRVSQAMFLGGIAGRLITATARLCATYWHRVHIFQ